MGSNIDPALSSPSAFDKLPLDTKEKWSRALFFAERGQTDEAVIEYGRILQELDGNGSRLLLGLAAIRRAEIYLDAERYEEAGEDLSLAERQLPTRDGVDSQDLLLTLGFLSSRLPAEQRLRLEEIAAASPEPEVEVVAEVLVPVRRAPVPPRILPQVQPAGT